MLVRLSKLGKLIKLIEDFIKKVSFRLQYRIDIESKLVIV